MNILYYNVMYTDVRFIPDTYISDVLRRLDFVV